MNDEFKRMFLGEWPVDPLYEEYMVVWDRYFAIVDFDRRAANKIIFGYTRMKDFDKDKWRLAKQNSLRYSEQPCKHGKNDSCWDCW